MKKFVLCYKKEVIEWSVSWNLRSINMVNQYGCDEKKGFDLNNMCLINKNNIHWNCFERQHINNKHSKIVFQLHKLWLACKIKMFRIPCNRLDDKTAPYLFNLVVILSTSLSLSVLSSSLSLCVCVTIIVFSMHANGANDLDIVK